MVAERAIPDPVGPVRVPADRRATPVRGRTAELDALGALVGRLADGHGGVLVFAGGTGSGKSRLLAEARSLATAAGFRALGGAAEAESRLLPLAPLLDALHGPVDPVLGPEPARRLATGTDQRYQVLDEFQDQLERAARRTPLLITIDDLHWADDATRFVLRALPERLAGHRVAWVLTTRPADADPTLTRLADGGATIHPLRPLDDTAVEAVARDVLGRPPSPAERALAHRAGGEPLLLVELLRGLAEQADVFSGRLRAVIGRRVERLSEPAQEAVRIGAAVGDRFTVTQLATLLDRSPAALTGPLEELAGEGLLTSEGGQRRFRTGLVREVLSQDLPVDLVRALRRQAVDADLADGRPVLEVADALLDSALPGDLAAVELLRRAASAAVPGRAVELLTGALELAPADHAVRAGLIEDAVGAYVLAGRAADGLALAERSLQGRLDPEVEARIRLSIAVVHREYSFAQSVRHSTTALGLSGVSGGTRARLLATRALTRIRDYEIEATAALLPSAMRLARATGDVEALSALRAVEACVRLHTDGITAARASLAAARDLVDAPLLWSPALLTAVCASMAGEVGAALAAVDAAAPGRGGVLRALRARLRFDAGALAEAAALAAAFPERPETMEPDHTAAIIGLYTAGRAALASGDEAGIAGAARNAQRMRDAESLAVRCTGAWLAALVADAQGDPARALALAAPALARLEGVGPWLAEPPDPGDPALLVRIALRAGNQRLAERIASRATADAARNPDLPALVAGGAHARGLTERSPAELDRAIALLEPGERPLVLAAALEDAGRLAGRGDTGVGYLDRALLLLDRHGAHRDAARVRALLRELGVRRRRAARARGITGWAALTATELEVARIIGRGATKREAADRLFLSPHTVSTHLRNTYAKLGVRSRVELARIVLAEDQ
ncbi:ATP-binding protein [Cryptosporangium phraense]|uniref:AAA family ATPase n=1 Tax=Cryptosporangium phraense TaxID=2593070 RepID=A0A545AQ82_9ACTN|nr:LuxR family transcriptional regulator [Cryptosporangium phraense]TQS43464.1 AAA family ATPase [Cryptosporangium phraense]